MKRNWKFVGGPKPARTSLAAAVSVVMEKHEGEVAIFDAETGKLYDLTGAEFPEVSSAQYQQLVMLMGTLFSHLFHNMPVAKEYFLPMMLRIGNPVLDDVRAFAAEYGNALLELQKLEVAKKETENDPERRPEPSTV